MDYLIWLCGIVSMSIGSGIVATLMLFGLVKLWMLLVDAVVVLAGVKREVWAFIVFKVRTQGVQALFDRIKRLSDNEKEHEEHSERLVRYWKFNERWNRRWHEVARTLKEKLNELSNDTLDKVKVERHQYAVEAEAYMRERNEAHEERMDALQKYEACLQELAAARADLRMGAHRDGAMVRKLEAELAQTEKERARLADWYINISEAWADAQKLLGIEQTGLTYASIKATAMDLREDLEKNAQKLDVLREIARNGSTADVLDEINR
jgi:chromosome segregation ATPase